MARLENLVIFLVTVKSTIFYYHGRLRIMRFKGHHLLQEICTLFFLLEQFYKDNEAKKTI